MNSPPSLTTVVNWLKTMTTNEYIRQVTAGVWPPFENRIWQRSFHDHVIRTEEACDRIREYICHNPARWQEDELYLP